MTVIQAHPPAPFRRRGSLSGRPARKVDASLTFRKVAGRTGISHQHTPHPFHMTRPFHRPGEDGLATLYLQSSSGGLYGDDDLSLKVETRPQAAAHVTTQASTVVHPSRGGRTRQRLTLIAGLDSLLEICPDPVILFPGAHLESHQTLSLAPGARAILADSALAHDPDGAAAPFERWATSLTLTQAEAARPLLVERTDLLGADWRDRLSGYGCTGWLLVAGTADPAAAAGTLFQTLGTLPDTYAGATALEDRGIAMARFLCRDGVALSRALALAWQAARAHLTGGPPPRLHKK